MAELNRALKSGLDVLTGGQADAWTKPIQSAEDAVARGILDENGNATSKGVLFTDLQDQGLVATDGALTEKGWAYGMPEDAALAPENLWAFKVRTADGVDSPEVSFGDMAGGVGEFAYDAIAGFAKQVVRTHPAMLALAGQENRDRAMLAGVSIADGSIKASEELGTMLQVAGAWGTQEMADSMSGQGAGKETLWATRQNLARVRKYHQDAAVGEVIQDLTTIEAATTEAAELKKSLPPKEYAEITKQAGSVGQLLDPSIMIPAGAAAKAGKLGIISRAGIKADRVLVEVAEMDARIAAKSVEAAAATTAAESASRASQLATRLGNTVGGERAIQAQGIAARTAKESEIFGTAAGQLGEQLAEMGAKRESLAVRIPENVAKATKTAIQAGQAAKSIPVQAFGQVLEKTGDGLIFINDTLKTVAEYAGLGKAYELLRVAAPIGSVATFGLPGAASAALAAGPALRGYGRFSQIVGKELSWARGQVPFWQRVANNPTLTPIHRGLARLTDTATMGGVLTGAVRSGAKGIAAAGPIDLAFEYLADGGDPNADTFKRAAASALVIGGSSGMLGGMLTGTKARHRELALGDELNFRQDLTPEQKPLFESLPVGAKRAISTYAASNPQLKIVFSTGAQSSFSAGNNTATIALRSSNPIKPLIAHEILHHTIIRNQMEDGVTALLLGDGQSGGILRANDGKLSKDFETFWDRYNQRRTASGESTVGIKEAAIEYYIEASADHVASLAESGELGAIAGRTDLGRAIGRVAAATVGKLPVIRDLHFKTGGLMEPNGVMVQGNGLLAGGIRELPQIRAMTNQMLRQSSGRSQGLFKAAGRDTHGGFDLPTPEANDPLVDKYIAAYETEEIDGQTRVKRDKEGNPVPLQKYTIDRRNEIGKVIVEHSFKQRESGKAAMPNEIHVDEDGSLTGTHLSEAAIKAIKDAGILNTEQIRILREVNRAVKDFDGSNYLMINHPALKTTGNRKRYAPQPATLRDAVPLAIEITKDGNLMVALMSVTKLSENLSERINTKRGKRLYQGNREALLADANAVMEIHNKGLGTDQYFQEKYGNQASEYKNFVNTVFGLMTDSQKTGSSKGKTWVANPLFEMDSVGYKDNVFKTYRLDRISQATRATGDSAVKMPFVYESVKLNLMPNGLPEE